MRNYEDEFEDWADSVLYPKKKNDIKGSTPDSPQAEAPIIPMDRGGAPTQTGIEPIKTRLPSEIPPEKQAEIKPAIPEKDEQVSGLLAAWERAEKQERGEYVQPVHNITDKTYDYVVAAYKLRKNPTLGGLLTFGLKSPLLESVSRPFGAVQEILAKPSTPGSSFVDAYATKLGDIARRTVPEVFGEPKRETPPVMESLQAAYPEMRKWPIASAVATTGIELLADPLNLIGGGAARKLTKTEIADDLVKVFKVTKEQAVKWIDNGIIPESVQRVIAKPMVGEGVSLEAGMARIRKEPTLPQRIKQLGGLSPSTEGAAELQKIHPGIIAKKSVAQAGGKGQGLDQMVTQLQSEGLIPKALDEKDATDYVMNELLRGKEKPVGLDWENMVGDEATKAYELTQQLGREPTLEEFKQALKGKPPIPEPVKPPPTIAPKGDITTPELSFTEKLDLLQGRMEIKKGGLRLSQKELNTIKKQARDQIIKKTPETEAELRAIQEIPSPAETGIGKIPPEKSPAPPMGPASAPNEWNEFHDLLTAGRLTEAEQKIPLIKGNMSKQSALEYLEDAKAKLIEAEDYYKQFPTAGEGKPKPEMLSYEEVYPTKYEMDIAKEQAFNKHVALRDKTLALVEAKDLSNDTMARIRRGLNIGSIKKASTPQLEELYTFVTRLEKGDKFISPKQLEALTEILKDIEHPELTPKRIIIDRFGDKEEVLGKGIMGKIPNQLMPTVDIKEGHPLITRIVNKADDLMWKADNETARRLTNFDKMLSAAEKFRPERGIKEKLLKTNPEIFDALSGKTVELTKEERGVVAYLRNFFAKARKDLELDKFRKNYVTHIEQNLIEKIWNQGIKKTVSEMMGAKPKDPNIPTDIMLALDDIIGSEKFFKFAQKRTGGITPTQNLRMILEEYSDVYERVKALNQVLPEAQAVQQLLLQSKSARWMKRYLQNLKGRALDFEFRNGKAAWLANVGDKIVDIGYIKLLGLNYWSALKNLVAGEANIFITTPFKSHLTGKARFMLSPKKALKMAKEYGILNNMYYEYATTGFKGVPRKLERYSMVGQAIGESEIRTSMLLSELTPEEWAKGVISMDRRRQVLDRIAQAQGIFSKTQSPLLLQTAPGRMIFQMNRWRITNALLVRRVTNAAIKDMKSGLMNTQNTRNLAKMFMLYSSGMYLSYELGKEGYEQASRVAKSMAETINNMVELVTTDTLIKMFSDNPSLSVLGEFAYTAQELAAYIGVPGIQEPRKVIFRKGIEDTYIAPYERTMELIGANDDVTGDKSDEFERIFKKEMGIDNPEDAFENSMGIK